MDRQGNYIFDIRYLKMMKNRNTIEFLGIWESVNNPVFNYGEFAIIKSMAGLNSYKISVKEWVEKTNAIGLKATAGRYGGTYAHEDIAMEYGIFHLQPTAHGIPPTAYDTPRVAFGSK